MNYAEHVAIPVKELKNSGRRENYTFGMTRDELRKYVLETLAPNLEKALRECENLTACVEKSRQEAEKSRQEIEQEREARRTSDKENEDLRKEIERLKKELEDAKNTKATNNRNRFGSSSRKTQK